MILIWTPKFELFGGQLIYFHDPVCGEMGASLKSFFLQVNNALWGSKAAALILGLRRQARASQWIAHLSSSLKVISLLTSDWFHVSFVTAWQPTSPGQPRELALLRKPCWALFNSHVTEPGWHIPKRCTVFLNSPEDFIVLLCPKVLF